MKKIIFALLCLFISVSCEAQKVSRLSVTSPPALIEKIRVMNQNNKREDETAIECELANFGSVQYGTRTMGEVHVANPYNACNKTEIVKHQEEFQRIPFLLVERGSCAFADKVYNAQESGAKIVIIVDNNAQKNNVIMIDNGHGYNVHITSVFINKAYGDTIKNFMEANPNEPVNLSLELNQQKVDKSVVRLWIDLSSPLSTKMIHSFNPIRKNILDNEFNTEPVFDIEKKTKFSKPNDSDCRLYKNQQVQYCSPDPDDPQKDDDIVNKKNVATGANIIDEAIRQLCVFEQGEEIWYEYYNEFGNDCFFLPQEYERCSKIVIKKMTKLDMEEYNKCITIESKITTLLDRQVQINERFQIYEWPAVTVNDMLYRGNLEGDNIAESICNSLLEVNEDCEKILDPNSFVKKDEPKSSSSSGIFVTLLLIVLAFTIVFFITAYCYKRIVRREVSQDVDQKVNQMVSQYIAFYETRGKNAGDQSNI